jgi:hypothetical protein
MVKKMADRYIADPLSLEDDKLARAVFHNILHRIGEEAFKDQEAMIAILNQCSAGQRMIYFTDEVDLEVRNGGFNQYFWNRSGRFAFEALEGYELIGAVQFAEAMKAAIAQSLAEAPKMRRLFAQHTIEAFSKSYRRTKLADADHMYYLARTDEPIAEIQARFIRSHPDQFDLDRLEKCAFAYDQCELAKLPPRKEE